jgi:hypothetical protein
MPYLPGGGVKQILLLRSLLQAVLDHDGMLAATITDGGGERSLRDALKPLSSAGFVNFVDRDHVAVSDEALEWLQSTDDRQLLAIFHRHIRYVGELLKALDGGPLSARDLMRVAEDRYDLAWTTATRLDVASPGCRAWESLSTGLQSSSVSRLTERLS